MTRKRHYHKTARRNWTIFRALLEGQSTEEVAARFNVTLGRVRNIRRRCRAILSDEEKDRCKEMQAVHLERLEEVFLLARASFFASCEDTEETEISRDSGGDQKTHSKIKRKGQAGNPAHLREMREAMADQRKIVGADAPIRIEHGNTVSTDERRTELAGIFAALRERAGIAEDQPPHHGNGESNGVPHVPPET